MITRKHIDGAFYSAFHPGWGGFSEELFYYTSRYYAVTEAFLRNLAGRSDFVMSGYKAARLSEPQRRTMGSVLCSPPDHDSCEAAIWLVEAVLAGESGVDAALRERFPGNRCSERLADGLAGHAHPPHPPQVSPLEAWLSMAEHLQLAAAVREKHVEVDMRSLAGHLDSPNPTVRANLQDLIVQLHQAGYLLRNHPHLTHAEALRIGEQGAV